MMDMNPEIRARWVAALRSGKYTQAKGYLHVADEGLCCLGVLCELAVEAGVVHREPAEGDGGEAYIYEYTGSYAGYNEVADRVLPQQVLAWAQMDVQVSDPRVVIPPTLLGDGDADDEQLLTVLNDDLSFTFAQIADAVEYDGTRS